MNTKTILDIHEMKNFSLQLGVNISDYYILHLWLDAVCELDSAAHR